MAKSQLATGSGVGPEVAHYLELYRACAQRLPGRGTGWLDRAREDAIARFEATGFPTPRDEAWKYTNVAAIARRPFHVLLAGPEADRAPAPDDAVERALAGLGHGLATGRLVFVNGRFDARRSRVSGASAGSLGEVLRTDAERVAPYLRVDEDVAGFRALNTALSADGAFVHVPAGGPEQTLALVFVTAGDSELATHARNIVALEAGARARLVEVYLSADASAQLTNVRTDVHLGAGADLEHFRMQLEDTRAYQIGAVDVSQERESRYVSHAVAFGGRLSRCDIETALAGPRAECTLNGLYLVSGRQHVDFHTRIEHLEPRCASRELYKGILDGHARGVFNGAVVVHPGAQGTDATQANHNLLLSRDAEVDTKPQLEIYADDVKCSHGATVGQLDSDALFYLRSRGLDEAAARATLTYGFAGGVLEQMSLPGVRQSIAERLGRLLPAAVQTSLPDEVAQLLSPTEALA